MSSLVASVSFKNIKLEIHHLSNLFSIGKTVSQPRDRYIVNSGNEYLVGAQLPYFPRAGLPRVNNVLGGPGSWQMSSNWCGMSAGDMMVYPAQALDGQLDTGDLRHWIVDNVSPGAPSADNDTATAGHDRLRRLHLTADQVRCPTGQCVWSPTFGEHKDLFNLGILHTVSPYNSDPDRDQKLTQCYSNCIKTALSRQVDSSSQRCITTALLGTGVKLIDYDVSTKSLQKTLISSEALSEGKTCEAEICVELVLQSLQSCDLVMEVFKS